MYIVTDDLPVHYFVLFPDIQTQRDQKVFLRVCVLYYIVL